MQTDFLPQTLTAWVGLLIQVVAVSMAVGAWVLKFIRQPLLEQINGVGTRVKSIEECDAKLTGKIEGLERSDERTNFQIAAMAERQGRIEGHQEKMDNWLEAFEEKAAELNTQTQARLAGIEAKLDLLLSRSKS